MDLEPSSHYLVAPGLLLSYAVNSSHTPYERFAIYWNYAPISKDLLYCLYSPGVVYMTENRSQYHLVRNVEIRVTCGKTIEVASLSTCSANDSGHWQTNNVQGFIACVGHVTQSLQI